MVYKTVYNFGLSECNRVLRKAKIVQRIVFNFGLSECNRFKITFAAADVTKIINEEKMEVRPDSVL